MRWWDADGRRLIRWYLLTFRPYRGGRRPLLVLALGAMLIETLCTLPVPWLTMRWIDRIIEERSGALLLRVIMAWTALLVLRGGAGFGQFLLCERFRIASAREARLLLTRHVMSLPLTEFTSRGPGYLLCRIRDDVDHLQPLWAESGLQTLRALLYLAGAIAFVGRMHPGLLMAAAALLPLYLSSEVLFAARVRRLSLQGREEHGRMEERLFESLQAIVTVRVLGAERHEVLAFARRLHAWTRTSWRLDVSVRAAQDVASFGQALAPLFVLAYAAHGILSGAMTMGMLVAFAAYSALILEPVALLSRKSIELERALASLDRIEGLLARPRDAGVGPAGALSRAVPPRGSRGASLTLRGVLFAYAGGPVILDRIDCDVPAGRSLGIVGASGSGKTTLACLAAGLLQPSSGAILIDGTDIRAYDPRHLRRRISMVHQDPFLWNASIRDNVTHGVREASEERIRDAVRRAYAEAFIHALPNGYDAAVGSRGERLSGGERARIALARALLRDPDILILDEATAFLDPRSEECLRRAIRDLARTRTLIVIAHRAATVASLDELIVLDGGRIRERGSPRSLLARHGPCTRLLFPRGTP